MINALKKLRTKEFTVSPEIVKYVDVSRNVSYSPEKIALIGGFVDQKTEIPGDKNILSFYSVNGRQFVCIDKKIHELKNGTLNKISDKNISTYYDYVKILYKGKEEVFFFYYNDGIITGGENPVMKIPDYNYYDVYNGRVFFAKGKRVYFSRDFNVKENSFDLRADFYVDVKEKYGSISGIKTLRNKLYVFCEKAILYIEADNSQLGLKLQETDYLSMNIRRYSVSENSGQLTFINDGQICRFDGKKITETGVYLSESEDQFITPRTFGKYYIKCITVPYTARCLLVVDVEEKSQHKTPIYDDLTFSREEGSGVNETTRKVIKLTPDSMPQLNGYISTKKFKLCENKDVCVVGLSAEVKGSCNIIIKIGYKYVEYEISEEKNYIKCFHIGNEISLSLKNFSQDFELKNLKIKLRKRK